MIEAREIKPNSVHICIEDIHMRRSMWLELPQTIDTDTILRNVGISLLNTIDKNTDEIDAKLIMEAVDKIAKELDEY